MKRLENIGFGLYFWGILFFLLILIVGSVGMGRLYISPENVIKILCNTFFPIEKTWTDQAESAIFMIRLPRVLSAVMIGGALALSGAAYQSVFKNPLVAPDMLGVSSGACVGASLAILLGLSSVSIQLWALMGGLLAVSCAVSIPKIIGKKLNHYVSFIRDYCYRSDEFFFGDYQIFSGFRDTTSGNYLLAVRVFSECSLDEYYFQRNPDSFVFPFYGTYPVAYEYSYFG